MSEIHHTSRLTMITSELLMILLFLSTIPFAANGMQCTPAEIRAIFPTSAELGDVNDKLMTDNGPTPDHKNQTINYSRRWQGGSGTSRTVSVTLTIYPDSSGARKKVNDYGKNLLKSKQGHKLPFGDEGYRTDDLFRPYYLVHKGRFLISYFAYYPRRTLMPSQDATVEAIIRRIAALPCQGTTPPPPPPPNRCPKIEKLTYSPSSPVPGDTITLNAIGKDPDGDKLVYTWQVTDFKGNDVPINGQGSTRTWTASDPGTYKAGVTVYDGQCITSKSSSIMVFTDPNRANRPPVIKLKTDRNTVSIGEKVTITATVTDPDGDPLGQGRWERLSFGSATFLPIEKRNGNTFTDLEQSDFPGKGLVAFIIEDNRGALAREDIQIVTIDPRQALNVKLTCDHPWSFSCKVEEHDQVTFTATVNNPGNDPLTYAWTIDGQPQRDWKGPQATWYNVPFKRPGSEIKIQVWGKNGATASDSTFLEIKPAQSPPPTPPANQKPKVHLQCLTAKPRTGQAVRFKAMVSDPDPNDKLKWTWHLDGQATGWSGLTPSWKTPNAGNHSVMITVTDGSHKVSDKVAFTVQAPPPPPPPVIPIIKNAVFIDTNMTSAWGNAQKTNWQVGDEITLKIELNPLSRSHRLEIIWSDTAGVTQKREKINLAAGIGWGQSDTIWSVYQSSTGSSPGLWQVEILIDGLQAQMLSFNLKTRVRTPTRQPRWHPLSKRPPAGPGSSNGTMPATPATNWKPAF
ncbi:MAG: PKD domain-containing protein [Deltaproteobacteria bacterium]|nr:PKD domain-containing protein [Deltaproteobacteria bacterium]